jgi:hypothetical protein
MPNNLIRQPNFGALVVLVWLVVALALLLQYWGQTAEGLLGTDDAMRLVQMRAWLAGQGWFDLHNARIVPPGGYDSHWSRLIDAGLAALLLLFQYFDPQSAERLMRAWWPLLWLCRRLRQWQQSPGVSPDARPRWWRCCSRLRA